LKTYQKSYIIDSAHYLAQFFWVLANILWATDEFGLFINDDNPYELGDFKQGSNSGRWWAAVLCVLAFVPILLMYFVWIPYVLYNATKEGFELKIKDVRIEENLDSQDSTIKSSKCTLNPIFPLAAIEN